MEEARLWRVRFEWQGWFVAHQCIDTAQTRDCEWWLTAWAGAQFRANEAEALAAGEFHAHLEHALLKTAGRDCGIVNTKLI